MKVNYSHTKIISNLGIEFCTFYVVYRYGVFSFLSAGEEYSYVELKYHAIICHDLWWQLMSVCQFIIIQYFPSPADTSFSGMLGNNADCFWRPKSYCVTIRNSCFNPGDTFFFNDFLRKTYFRCVINTYFGKRTEIWD